MRKVILAAAIALIAVGCFLGGLFLFSAQSTPEDTVEHLQNAINDGDVDGMIACFNAEMAEKMNVVVDAADGDMQHILSKSFTALQVGIPILSAWFSDGQQIEMAPSIRLELTQCSINGKHASGILHGNVLIGEKEVPFSKKLYFEQEGTEWLISQIGVDEDSALS